MDCGLTGENLISEPGCDEVKLLVEDCNTPFVVGADRRKVFKPQKLFKAMNSKKKVAGEVKRSPMKKADDLRRLVIRLQNDPVAMRQARKLVEAV